MRTVGNILWLALAGWWLALGYVIAGVLACILIVTIPFGIQAFKLAAYTIWPFGRVVVQNPDSSQAVGLVANIIWLVIFGIELAFIHVVAGVVLCLTLVGIPLGLACFKLVPLTLMPFGKMIVPADTVPEDGDIYIPTFGLGRPDATAQAYRMR